jgi:putative endonuclease
VTNEPEGPARHLALARRGETLAARWLGRRGYRIIARNLRVGRDEADLVALDPDGATVVVVEVKTRGRRASEPEARVDRVKRARLVRLATRLERRRAYRDRPFRFDVIAIEWPAGGEPEVRHFEAAFEA